MPDPTPIWLYEAGIGEDRAILTSGGAILAARIERHGVLQAGLVAPARLVKQIVPAKRGIAKLTDGGGELLLSPLPAGLTEGGEIMVELRRAAIGEAMRDKLPLARPAPGQMPRAAPTLRDRIAATGDSLRQCHAHEADHFDAAGWHDILEAARSGMMPFPGGSLIISVTPAMTVIDIDGEGSAVSLALAGAISCAKAIRLFDLQGSIGIDFPGMADKADRQAAAAAFDGALTGDYERTAINGFGFMQIIRRRTGPSLPEMLQMDPVTDHALDLLRRAERARGSGDIRITANPRVIERLEQNPDWIGEVGRRTGRTIRLHADPKMPIAGGHAG